MSGLKLHIYQLFESIKEHGIKHSLNDLFYFGTKKAVIMQKHLDDLQPLPLTKNQHIKLIEINNENFDSLNLKYTLKNRYLKAIRNIRDGGIGYCIVEDNKVLGDLWCFFPNKGATVHRDLELLGLTLSDTDVYGCDMYLSSSERGKSSLVSHLIGGALHNLKQKGYKCLKCYVMSDRIPALWIHRVLGFKEIDRLEAQRFVFYKRFIKSSAKGKSIESSVLFI